MHAIFDLNCYIEIVSSTFWISFFVFIAVIPIGIIILGILGTRKFNFLKKIVNKDNTEIFAGLLYIASFSLEFFFKDKGFISSLIFAILYISIGSLTWSSIAILLTNKFRFNKIEFYNAWFFGLLLMLYLFIRTQVLDLKGLGFLDLILMFSN